MASPLEIRARTFKSRPESYFTTSTIIRGLPKHSLMRKDYEAVYHDTKIWIAENPDLRKASIHKRREAAIQYVNHLIESRRLPSSYSSTLKLAYSAEEDERREYFAMIDS